MRHVRRGKNTHDTRGCKPYTASDGRALRDLDLAAAMQLPRPLRCRTPSASAAGSSGVTDRHPDKQNGMTIRLTLCERDATDGLGDNSIPTPAYTLLIE